MTNPKRCRAALYARYSTDKQSERSIDDQFHVCEDVTKRHGFTVIDRFEDAACSGGTTRRPGYQRMLDAAVGGVRRYRGRRRLASVASHGRAGAEACGVT